MGVVPFEQSLSKSRAPVSVVNAGLSLDRETNSAAWRATSERNGTNRGYPKSPEPDVKSRDYRGRAGAVFEDVYVVCRRICGAEDDREKSDVGGGMGEGQGGGDVIDEAPPVTVSLHLYKLS